jgi:hypothetical protein
MSGHELGQERVGFLEGGDTSAPELLHELVLKRLVGSLDATFGGQVSP